MIITLKCRLEERKYIPPFLFNTVFENLSRAIRWEKKKLKQILIGKEEVQLSLSVDYMILYRERPLKTPLKKKLNTLE